VQSTGGAQTRITNQPGHDITPSWSGDGGKIAFASNRAPQGSGFNFNIWTMDADGNLASQQPLVTGPAAELFADSGANERARRQGRANRPRRDTKGWLARR
jgi:hypothetical protein